MRFERPPRYPKGQATCRPWRYWHRWMLATHVVAIDMINVSCYTRSYFLFVNTDLCSWADDPSCVPRPRCLGARADTPHCDGIWVGCAFGQLPCHPQVSRQARKDSGRPYVRLFLTQEMRHSRRIHHGKWKSEVAFGQNLELRANSGKVVPACRWCA